MTSAEHTDRVAGLIARLDQPSVDALFVLLSAMTPDEPPGDDERVTAQRRAVLLRETWLAEQLDDYADLRALGLTTRQISVRMHVSLRTAERYERRLRAVAGLYDSLPGEGAA